MEVYAEYVILDNFVIDFCIIYAVLKTLGIKIKKWRIFFACFIGTAIALILPVFTLPAIAAFFLKLTLSLIMVFIYAKYSSKRKFVYSLILFYTYTFIMGGACIGILYLISAEFSIESSINYNSALPLGLIIFIIFGYVYLILLIARFFKKRKDVINFIYNAEIFYKGKNQEIKAFLDSGNRLYYKDLPVVVINLKTALNLIDLEEIDFLLNFNKNFESVIFSDISGKQKKMPVLFSDKIDIFINGQPISFLNVPLAISFKGFSDLEKYDALLHPNLIAEKQNGGFHA